MTADCKVHAALLACALVWSTVVLGQNAGDLTINVAPCIALRSDLERYDCYERLVAAAQERQQADSAAQATPAPRRAPEIAQDEPRERANGEVTELFSVVSELDEIVPNRVLITLENGQIWRQTQAKRYQLRVGHTVRIYPSRWGNDFRLSATDVNGFIQVERIR